MSRNGRSALFLGLLIIPFSNPVGTAAGDPTPALPHWIWFDQGDPAADAPAGARYFRRTFELARPVLPLKLELTADNSFTAYVNGTRVGTGDRWEELFTLDVTKHMVEGRNVIAVRGVNDGGPAGLIVRLSQASGKAKTVVLVSDGRWKSAETAPAGWEQPGFDDRSWKAARDIGEVGKAGPWTALVWGGGGSALPASRFTVPAGFVIEEGVHTPDDDPRFSLVNMCFDDRGRLLVSREGGPVFLCTGADQHGVLGTVKPYCRLVKNCQGMCWAGAALYLVGDGPNGTGLYRCHEAPGGEETRSAELVCGFRGGMGEHGPHAVIHGPDGFLYVVLGNHSWADVKSLATNSPLRRWPNGGPGPDQGKLGTTEDVLVPRLNDAHGHAADILAPGGTIWRLDPGSKKPGKDLALVAAGFRNAFDAAFSPTGDLFTFDSDMEWDEGLPWYRPVRICHVPMGAEFGWRTGASKIPPAAIDTLPAAYNTGRGSPVGVEFYDHRAFPAKYRGAAFMCDWSLGIIYAVFPKKSGASYTATVEKFCTGNPLNVTDCAVAPDGSLWFTVGGRNTQGGVYRIRAEKPGTADTMRFDQPLAAWARRPGQPWEGQLNIRSMTGQLLVAALKNSDPWEQRRACEGLIRTNIEPPVDAVWPLLGSEDRFLRTAARLVLQRIDPAKWVDKLWQEADDRTVFEGIIALCKEDKAEKYAEPIFGRLHGYIGKDQKLLLDYLRTLELTLAHTTARPVWVRHIVKMCQSFFPQADPLVNRQLAILLTGFARERLADRPVHAMLLEAMRGTRDRQQQIHYFYCLRLLHTGWTPDQKAHLLTWFEATRTWDGGFSFTPYLENIFRDVAVVFTGEDIKTALARAADQPFATGALLKLAAPALLPEPAEFWAAFERLRLGGTAGDHHRTTEAVGTLVSALARHPSPGAAAVLRRIAEADPGQRHAVAQGLARFPAPENAPYLVRGLDAANPVLVLDLLDALKKMTLSPAKDDPAPYRAVLLASQRLEVKQRWRAVEVLRAWTAGRQFGAEPGDAVPELAAWGRWFGQTFPKEPPLPDLGGPAGTAVGSKYRYDELLRFVETAPAGRAGDPVRGRAVFEKAQCLKCHKYGKDGEGIGPDLTTLSKRFNRSDVLESIYYPSKVISDQYRATTVITAKDQTLHGLIAAQGDLLTIVQSDGSKISLPKADVRGQFSSLVSVMPERLLDPLSLPEIADLFAFLESAPK